MKQLYTFALTATALILGGCAVAPITTMTTNDSIRSPATAASNRKWHQFLRIAGPAIYRYNDGVVYKTADNRLSYQAQEVSDDYVEQPEQMRVSSGPRPKYDTGMSSYTDSESNGHTVTWDTDLDGNRVYTDSVTSPIIGGRYYTTRDTTRTYITAP